ncbi:glutathione S-transferase theta-1-like [Musca vetustissima]|uniref:glutathione S-transferase theta-1-like n=1 Tax=Musca vetustissima TaxID=27455 RepID=UPI002AB6FCE9|nr:glutathione S-transferase theta-1-like [Musca vetustissima]
MTKIKYFYDLMSQPSRALWIALQMSRTSYEDCPVAIRKLEHRSAQFKKINRFQKVPCIVDGDFHLGESIAILRYLSDKGHIDDQLYCKDLQKRAQIDEFLEWQHLSVRLPCATYFLQVGLYPMMGLAEVPTVEKMTALQKDMETNLKLVENIWLKDKDFLTGNKMTAADLFGACEIEQIKICKYNVSEKFPKISEWLSKVRQESNPFYDNAHKYVNKLAGV